MKNLAFQAKFIKSNSWKLCLYSQLLSLLSNYCHNMWNPLIPTEVLWKELYTVAFLLPKWTSSKVHVSVSCLSRLELHKWIALMAVHPCYRSGYRRKTLGQNKKISCFTGSLASNLTSARKLSNSFNYIHDWLIFACDCANR